MRQFHINKGVKGSRTVQERVLRFAYMINEEAKRRARALTFWETHGDDAVVDAFGGSIRTLYRWKRALVNTGGKLEGLNNKSRRPKRVQRRIIPDAVEEAILRLRREHPRIGKDKMTPLLNEEGFNLSVSYVGRCITTLKKRGVIKDPPIKRYGSKKRKPKLRRGEKSGYEIDTVTRFVDGVKTYIVTALNLETRFAFARGYRSHSSKAAEDFLKKLREVSPVPVTHVQTDNGTEFAGHFDRLCEKEGIIQYYTYPRSPKMNAHVERFNRSLSEEFLVYHRALMRDDLEIFNQKLVDYLLWYNTKRPHASIGYISPLRYYCNQLTDRDCHMLWPGT